MVLIIHCFGHVYMYIYNVVNGVAPHLLLSIHLVQYPLSVSLVCVWQFRQHCETVVPGSAEVH